VDTGAMPYLYIYVFKYALSSFIMTHHALYITD
jgi:hypothetical protein